MGILDFFKKKLAKEESLPFKSFNRQELEDRLKAMAEDEDMKTGERSMGAMCYCPATPEKITVTCEQCGKQVEMRGRHQMHDYVNELRKLGLDCKLELWCKDCCKGIQDISTTEKEEILWAPINFAFYARLKPEDEYVRSFVFLPELQTLYQFLINQNRYSGRYGVTHFVGEETETVKRLLGLNQKDTTSE